MVSRRITYAVLLLVICFTCCHGLSENSGSLLDEDRAVDIVTSFLRDSYPEAEYLFESPRYFHYGLNRYGNAELECYMPDQILAWIAFELDSQTDAVLTYMFYDATRETLFVNCLPDDWSISLDDAIQISREWISEHESPDPDALHLFDARISCAPDREQVHDPHWQLFFTDNGNDYTVELDALTGEVVFCKFDQYEYDGWTRRLLRSDAIVLPESTKIGYSVYSGGRALGGITAYRLGSGEEEVVVMPLFGLLEILGGDGDPLESRTVTICDRTFSIDIRHTDLMPAGRYSDTGLLEACCDNGVRYCHLYDDLYVDIDALQTFVAVYLNHDVELIRE